MRAKLRKNPVPVKYHQYGAVPGRRREEAIAIAHNVKHRCLRSRKNHAQFFRDAAGAFNSITHHAIEQDLYTHQNEADARFFIVVHANAHLDMAGVQCWRITKGTLPGHTIGGDMFLGSYGAALDRYIKRKDREWEKIRYQERDVDMSITTFVDDIGEFMIAQDADSLHFESTRNTQILMDELQEVGAKLEPSKETVIPRMMGRCAHKETQAIQAPGRLTDGQKKSCARYLGAWPQMNGGINVDIAKHRTAMKTGFYAFQGLWGSSKVAFAIKKNGPEIIEHLLHHIQSMIRRDTITYFITCFP